MILFIAQHNKILYFNDEITTYWQSSMDGFFSSQIELNWESFIVL